MDIEKGEGVYNYQSEESELEILRNDYTNFLIDIFDEMKQRADKNGFLWFDRCTFPQFQNMALRLSTGPPRKLRY